jgi:hypothetical protein
MGAAFKPFLHAHFFASSFALDGRNADENWQQKIIMGAMTKNDEPSKPDFLSSLVNQEWIEKYQQACLAKRPLTPISAFSSNSPNGLPNVLDTANSSTQNSLPQL